MQFNTFFLTTLLIFSCALNGQPGQETQEGEEFSKGLAALLETAKPMPNVTVNGSVVLSRREGANRSERSLSFNNLAFNKTGEEVTQEINSLIEAAKKEVGPNATIKGDVVITDQVSGRSTKITGKDNSRCDGIKVIALIGAALFALYHN